MQIQILASDLDGTLLNENSKISKETAQAVKKAQKEGKRFVAVTGRAWNTACPIFQEAGIWADYILMNGAEFRLSSGKVIFQEAIDKEIAERIIEYLLQLGIDFEINTDKGDFSTNIEVCDKSMDFKKYDQIAKEEPKILKFFVFSNDTDQIQLVKQYLKDWTGITITSSALQNVEITSEAAKKGTMLERVADFYSVPKEEVVVFGDGENDQSLFKTFEHSRAMKNAVPAIRKIAEKVIESNRENGVAKEIDYILGGL